MLIYNPHSYITAVNISVAEVISIGILKEDLQRANNRIGTNKAVLLGRE